MNGAQKLLLEFYTPIILFLLYLLSDPVYLGDMLVRFYDGHAGKRLQLSCLWQLRGTSYQDLEHGPVFLPMTTSVATYLVANLAYLPMPYSQVITCTNQWIEFCTLFHCIFTN